MLQQATFSGLQDILEGALCRNPSKVAIRRLVERCHRFSLAYLRRRARAGRLNASAFGLDLDDLALDCVADLFKRDERGRLVRLEQYFDGLAWRDLDEAGLEMTLRRLVFSAINEGLFRRYQEWDPTLGRIIRNVKRHLHTTPSLELHREQFGLVIRICGTGEESSALPLMPREVLEAQLHFAFEGKASVPSLVEVLPNILMCNGLYAPFVGLTELALAYRSVIERLHDDEEGSDEITFEQADHAEVVRRYLQESIEEVSSDMHEMYVNNRGISPSLYSAYFSTIRDVLSWQYVSREGEKASLRVALCKHVGEMTSPLYRKQHQAVLEYLVKLTQGRLVERAAHLV